ncbi:MAG: hypothetical protein ACOVOQ_09950 [Flavobacterium sp.]
MQLKNICIEQAKILLLEYGEFYPFAFGEKANGEVVSISSFTGNDYPLSEDLLTELENALKISDNRNRFNAVAICLDVLDTPPYLTEKIDCLQIRIDIKKNNSFNVIVPYHKTEYGTITFLKEYFTEGSLNHFD